MGVVEELRAEQEHMDGAYARLDDLRASASSLAEEVIGLGRGGSVSDRMDRDARVRLSLARRAALSVGEQPLCFGRLDTESGERLHIGRLGVSDEAGEPLMVDWRAPVAEAFYRATSADRRGVVRRRHIRMKGRRVVGVDDELFTRKENAAGSELVGEAALLSSLEEARTGRMGDIVATIQSEQDAAIRAPMRGVLVVQGGPGTGKTAVALHRAAYLLYAHQFPLASQGVLVVGPNPVFCRYVGDVLPGLGETGVRLSTPGELVGAPAGAEMVSDPPEVAAAKADLDMADRLLQVVRSHQRPLEEVAHVGYAIHRLALTPADSARLVASAAAEPTYRAGRAKLEALLLALPVAPRRTGRPPRRPAGLARPPRATRAQVIDQLRSSPDVRALADRLWPELTPEAVVREALDAAGIKPSSGWSEHDLALLDEAAALIGPPVVRPRRRRPTGPQMDETMERTLSSLGHSAGMPRLWVRAVPVGRPLGVRATDLPKDLADRAGHVGRGLPAGAGDHRAGDRHPSRDRRRRAGPRDVRPCHRRRSPGPDAHAMADARPSLPDGIDDPGRRPRPGQRLLVGPHLVRGVRPGRSSCTPPGPRADDQLPDTRGGHAAGGVGAGRGRARTAAARRGAHLRRESSRHRHVGRPVGGDGP